MKRTVLTTAFAGLFAIAASASPAPALAGTPGPSPTAATTTSAGGADTVLAMNYPPRRYYPRRPPPRRVYVAPRYVPAPRRPVERPYRPMFHFGIGVHGASVISDSNATADSNFAAGGGFSLDIGWRIASSFSLDVGLTTSFHDVKSQVDSANLTALTVDGRFFLTDWNQRVQPYLQAGLGAYVLSYASDLSTLSGPGFQLGGGVDFYLTQGVSIGAKLLYRGAYVQYQDPHYPNTDSSYVSGFVYGGDVKFHF